MKHLGWIPFLLAAGCLGTIEEPLEPAGGDEGQASGGPLPGGPAGSPMTSTGAGPGSLGATGDGAPATPPLSPTAPPACAGGTAPTAGFTPLRRLTREQYLNTVRDLLGGARISVDALSADEKVGPFRTNLAGTVGDLIGQQYADAAETLARAAAPRIEALVPCNRATAGDAACAEQFIERFGLRAYRRPLSAEEKARYRSVHGAHAAQGGHANGLRVVVQVMLQSPYFLYHVEVGGAAAAGTVVPLDQFALASRLSYFLWGTMPDDTLLAAATGGKLSDARAVRAQVERMLRDPKVADGAGSFHRQWLELEGLAATTKDPKVYPAFTPPLRVAMEAETGSFVSHVLRKGDGRLPSLLAGPFTASADAALLGHYGATGAPAADGAVALPPAERAGLLTQAAFLAVHAGPQHSSPVQRGVVVIKNLLCTDLPDPPDDVNSALPAPSRTATTRERFARHRESPACAGCHTLIDGVGMGFEAYDGIGAFRTVENGRPVDASGDVALGGPELRGRFDGAVDLARKLAASPDVHLCVSRQWLRYALGRSETDADACSLRAALEAFSGARLDVRELLAAIAASDAFRHRRTER